MMNFDYIEIFNDLAERYAELLNTPEEIGENPVFNYIKNYGEEVYDEYAPDYKITPEVVYSDFLLDFKENFPEHRGTLDWLKKWFKVMGKGNMKESSNIHNYLYRGLRENYEKEYQYRIIVTPKEEDQIEMFDNLPSILADYNGDAIYGWNTPRSFFVDFERKSAADKFVRNCKGCGIEKDYSETPDVFLENKLRENYKAYDPEEWEPEDIELHKSIDWEARDYEPYPIEDTEEERWVYHYGNDVRGFYTTLEPFVKYLRANPIYPPYYAPKNNKSTEEETSTMYDGRRKGKYAIHDRKETWELYDLMSR